MSNQVYGLFYVILLTEMLMMFDNSKSTGSRITVVRSKLVLICLSISIYISIYICV